MGGDMYKQEPEKQRDFEDFYLPFGGHLNGDNRWIRLADKIPWAKFEEEYQQTLSQSDQGAPAKPFRMAFGALVIKEKLRITDEETVKQIRENPYLQYVIGMEGFRDEPPFDPSMMVHFRERINPDMISRINKLIREDDIKKNKKKIRKLQRKRKLS
jgi:hypothetical protein